MSTTHSPDVASTLATIRRIVGEGAGPPIADGKRVSIPMAMMDSTQRAVADAAEHDRQRRDAGHRLEAIRDVALDRRRDRYHLAHRDRAAAHTGSLAPIGVSADPALSAMHLSRIASTAHSEAETAEEAAIAARQIQEATVAHAAAVAARKQRFATGYKRGAQ